MENVRNQQGPTLEGIDMKYGRFNQQKIIWNINCVISESSLLFWRLDVAYFREKKELVFVVFAGPVREMAIPQHSPRHKLTKLPNYEHKIPRRITQADKSYTEAHT